MTGCTLRPFPESCPLSNPGSQVGWWLSHRQCIRLGLLSPSRDKAWRKDYQVTGNIVNLLICQELLPCWHRCTGDPNPNSALNICQGRQLTGLSRAKLISSLAKIPRLDIKTGGQKASAVALNPMAHRALGKIDSLAPFDGISFRQSSRNWHGGWSWIVARRGNPNCLCVR